MEVWGVLIGFYGELCDICYMDMTEVLYFTGFVGSTGSVISVSLGIMSITGSVNCTVMGIYRGYVI